MHRFLLIVAAGVLVALSAGIGRAGQEPNDERPIVAVARLEDEAISPGTARYLNRAIELAERDRAQCLVIVLDTPGGLLASTRTIVRAIIRSRTAIVVYVAPTGTGEAASAGMFITVAAHVAAMAPGTTIGAAHPVQVGGLPIGPEPAEPSNDETDDEQDDAKKGEDGEAKDASRRAGTAAQEKIVNNTVAWARSLAELRGRNADWAARAVSESVVATASEAVEQDIVDFIAKDLDELLAKLDGREVTLLEETVRLSTAGATVREVPMWWGEQVLATIANPNVAFLLLIFGFYGILFELYSPGWGVPGTLGVVCLVLAFFGLAVLPVNYVGLALVLVALGLFAAEVFVTSYGALTVAGVVCLVLGGLMLVESPEGFWGVSWELLAPVAAATGAIVLFLFGGVVRAHRGKVVTGAEGMIGIEVVAQEDFVPVEGGFAGTVRTRGELWRAIAEVPVAAGQRVRVRERRGLTLVVWAETAERGPSA